MVVRGVALALAALGYVHAFEEDVQCGAVGQPPCMEVGDDENVALLQRRISEAVEGELGPWTPAPTPSPITPSPPPITPSPAPITPYPPKQEDCIDNALDFEKVWNEYGAKKPDTPLRCVSQKLFGSFYQCGADRLYPDVAEQAWIFSKATLEQLLYLQYRDGRTPETMAAAGFVLIGFGPPQLDDVIKGWCLAVWTMPADATYQAEKGLLPNVPTASWWFYHMSTYGHWIDLETQKSIVEAYNSVGNHNVVDVFSNLTNCSVSDILTKANPFNGTWPSTTTCYKSIQHLAIELPAEQGVQDCVPMFMKNEKNLWDVKNPGDVRMMLNLCYDVNPYNTFIGLGWNAYPNPMVCEPPESQKNRQKYTGKEYVINNELFTVLGEINKTLVQITLANTTKEGNQKLAKEGFC